MQPSGPKMNPVEVALQQQTMGLQLKQIEAQNKLANAETAKTLAEANKIAGVDTKGQELNNKWQEIENRIQLSKENIAESNITEAAANAKKATELWKQEALNTYPLLVLDCIELAVDLVLPEAPSFLFGRRFVVDRKSTRLNSSHSAKSRMPSSA